MCRTSSHPATAMTKSSAISARSAWRGSSPFAIDPLRRGGGESLLHLAAQRRHKVGGADAAGLRRCLACPVVDEIGAPLLAGRRADVGGRRVLQREGQRLARLPL